MHSRLITMQISFLLLLSKISLTVPARTTSHCRYRICKNKFEDIHEILFLARHIAKISFILNYFYRILKLIIIGSMFKYLIIRRSRTDTTDRQRPRLLFRTNELQSKTGNSGFYVAGNTARLSSIVRRLRHWDC